MALITGFSGPEKLVSWNFEHNFDAAVIDDELFLRRTHRVSCVVPADEKIKLQATDRFRLPACGHIRMHGGPRQIFRPGKLIRRRHGRHLHPEELARQPVRVGSVMAPELCCLHGETTARQKTLRSCAQCYTDYRLSIDWGHDGHHSLELSTYHRLGRCRTVNERAWQALEWDSPHFSGPQRIEDLEEFGLGEIHSRWHRHRRESLKDWKSITPHWADVYYDVRYNPWLEAKYGGIANAGIIRKPRNKKEASWFCECKHYCPRFPPNYSRHIGRAPRPPWLFWAERLDSIMRRDPEDTREDRGENGITPPRKLRRAVFSDEENDDKFGVVFAG